ncbi:MAG TPA: UDP-N-acetylmuramate dehydrogenase [Planctomycetota bacterium]|nr:UDP-N-acetylmuramate dehydrogenase [Planctomycetota bacterium]
MPAFAAFEAFLRERAIPARLGHPLAGCTTFRIGGPARFLVQPRTEEDLGLAFRSARECDVPVRLLGGGSNLLVGDRGVDGAVLRLHSLDRVDWSPDGSVAVQGGASLPRLVKEATRRGLAGLQGLTGVPGTVAGALVMNAGGRHGEIGPTVRWVDILDAEGNPKRLTPSEAGFRYRTSDLRGRIVLGAGLQLTPDEPAPLAARYDEIMRDKKETQPLGRPNAGCIFKNPPGERAGRLIDRCGLKGARAGAARVSSKHANFIINEGRALADDVLCLVDRIRAEVSARFALSLELEILVW